MRLTKSLAGTWEFQLDPNNEVTVEHLAPQQQITVPMPWQTVFPELQKYGGYAWYRHQLNLTDDWLEGELLLHFGAVDYWCQVYINGQLAGEHEGGYTPFTLSIRQYVHTGDNELAVRVYDPIQSEINIPRWPSYESAHTSDAPPFAATEIPHGKQEWYVNVGGIWQDVTLTALPATYIKKVHVTTDIHTGEAKFSVYFGGDLANLENGQLDIILLDDNKPIRSVSLQTGSGSLNIQASFFVNNPKFWSPDSPYLYKVSIKLRLNDKKQDSYETRFGFREFINRDGKFFLNGEPFYLLSALDQDIYVDTIYTVPSEEYLRDEFRKAKELGLNNLRCHIKVAAPLYLDLADEMGLLVWAEIPSWRTFFTRDVVHPNQLYIDNSVKQRVEQTLREMIERDFNHPSIVIWTLVNEDWGTSLGLSASDRAWVANLYDLCKQLDPTRLVVDNSACPSDVGINVHTKTDLEDFHIYTAIPDQAANWERIIEQFALHPAWTFTTEGDAQRTGQEVLVLSEFGNWGLPTLNLLRQHYHGQDPDWFELGPWWSRYDGAPGWPKNVEQHYKQLGLETIWGDFDKFAEATQWHEFNALKFEIEALRRQQSIGGYVITELSDIYWESNGLLDFLRNPKVFQNVFHTINSPDVIIPQISRYAFWEDEQATAQLYLSHYGCTDWNDAKLTVNQKDATAKTYAVPEIKRGEVKPLGTVRLDLPKVEQAASLQFQFALSSSSQQTLAQNNLGLLVLPTAARQARYQCTVSVIGRTTDLALPELTPIGESSAATSVAPQSAARLQSSLQQLGYQVSDELTAATNVVVSSSPNTQLLEWVRNGGDLLYLSTQPGPFFWVKERGGATSWITGFHWLRPGIHSRLNNVSNPLSLPFQQIVPRQVITNLPLEDAAVQSDFLAGTLAGWVQHPGVFTIQFRYGKGRVIMTTFALEQALPGNPVAVAMFHDLLDYLTSEACQPKLEL